ncbi:MAG: galactose mutarotase [Acidobacteria bacterium]|nr:MAG: galactose mutarotase [Acidobacteriota bacterium]
MRATGCLSLGVAAFILFGAAACGGGSQSTTPMTEDSPRLSLVPFGQTADGKGIDLITLREKGTEVRLMTYGGIILSIKTPDRTGTLDDIALGYDTAELYFKNSTYFGVLVGRYANRIAKAKFTLDGKTYTLPANNGVNSLHGGTTGWDQKVWHAEPFQNANGAGVVLTLTSPDGDQGYPGEVKAKVTYTLTNAGDLVVDYDATTSAPTVINMTQHTYFNLGGSKANDILGHELMINADKYTPVDDTLIPTGELAPVAGTPFDFRTSTKIGARIDQANEQLKRGKGYDHNWVLNRTGDGLSLAAVATDPVTGRTLEISTTEPGIQFYSGNFLDGTNVGKAGKVYQHRGGFCLETQHYPDSPNQPSFPSTVLRPGGRYSSQTVFKFGVKK